MITILNVASRPSVIFEPTNQNHRKWFAKFLINRSWRDCPVQFYLEQEFADVPTMCQDKLTSYYLTRECREFVPVLNQPPTVYD
jgi:hypothetical protein